MDIKPLLQQMLEKKASDLHIRAKSKGVLRVDGNLEQIEGKIYNEDDTISLARSLMNAEQEKTFNARHEVDLAYTFEGFGRFRINVYSQLGNVNMVFRVVPIDIPKIADLKLPPVIQKIAENRRGLVLVTGTTGCGKSTTLASMINHINETRTAHIVTIEDPIEYIHTEKKSIISQRELGFDTLSYPDALRNVVRQDPNVILLGEMRDLDTMSAAITAAQTGHLVLSTIHTVDAAQSINRIIDLFPPHQQLQTRYLLADTLKAVISQRLLVHSSGHGRVPGN
jgi:twitching motility protein PilT